MPLYFSSSDPQYTIYMGKDKYENEYLIQWGWPEDLFFHVDDLSSAHIYLRTPFTYDLSLLKTGEDLLKVHPIPEKVIQECLQLCKYNSIEGNKKSQVDMIITPWLNLRKSMDMDTGTIGFAHEKLVLKIKNVATDRTLARHVMKTQIVKDLINYKDTQSQHNNNQSYSNKTKEEQKDYEREKANKAAAAKKKNKPVEIIDLEKERLARDERELQKKKQETKEKMQTMNKLREQEKQREREREIERQKKSYDRMFEDDALFTTNKNRNMTAQEYEDTFM